MGRRLATKTVSVSRVPFFDFEHVTGIEYGQNRSNATLLLIEGDAWVDMADNNPVVAQLEVESWGHPKNIFQLCVVLCWFHR